MCENQEKTEAEVLQEAAEKIAGYLYGQTAASKVTGKKKLLLTPFEEVEKETVESLADGIISGEKHEMLKNISHIEGKKDQYLYDQSIMTKHYAELDSLLEDKDILATIASVTRSDSKLYPRPTQFSKLMATPFYFSMDEILGAVARMKAEEAYEDIDVVEASNGKKGLYSQKHMTKRYAQALIQEIEVDGPANP